MFHRFIRRRLAPANAGVSGQDDAKSAVKRATQPSTPAPAATVPHHELRSAPVYNSAGPRWDPPAWIICVTRRRAEPISNHVTFGLSGRESNELFVACHRTAELCRVCTLRVGHRRRNLKSRTPEAPTNSRGNPKTNRHHACRSPPYGRLVAVSTAVVAPRSPVAGAAPGRIHRSAPFHMELTLWLAEPVLHAQSALRHYSLITR